MMLSKILTASCCLLYSKFVRPAFLREFSKEIRRNDGSTKVFEESNNAISLRNETNKGEGGSALFDDADQKPDNGFIA